MTRTNLEMISLSTLLDDYSTMEFTIYLDGSMAFYGKGEELYNVMSYGFMKAMNLEEVRIIDDQVIVKAYL